MLMAIPEAVPRYMQIHRGTIEARPEPRWSIGTDTFVAGGPRRAIVWEVSAVTDPGDLQRLRLLFQWVTWYIDFDELERRWQLIRDQPQYGPDAKQVFSSDGRPVLTAPPLPISRDTARLWYTAAEAQAVQHLDPDTFRGRKVWIKDVGGAVAFNLAVLRTMPNTKPPLALPLPGR